MRKKLLFIFIVLVVFGDVVLGSDDSFSSSGGNNDIDCRVEDPDYCKRGGICNPDDGHCYCAEGYWHRNYVTGCVKKPGNLAVAGSFCGLCFLLLLGKFLRMNIRILQYLYLPSSVIGGLIGLVFVQTVKVKNENFYSYLDSHWITDWEALPGFLINIVFAALFLGTEIPPVNKIWKLSGPNLCYGMFLSWSQWSMALAVQCLLLKPIFPDINKLFCLIIPIGFAGGHGTAVGLGPSFGNLGFDHGADIGLASATVGLLFSIVLGMVLVNIAARRNWINESRMQTATSKLSLKGINDPDDRPSAGAQTVSADSIDVLAFHLAVVGMSVLLGYIAKEGTIAIENSSKFLSEYKFFSGFPLFPFCMVGGVFLQKILQHYNRYTKLIDGSLMERISGTSLDFLIVSAMSSVNVGKVIDEIVPFVIIVLLCIAWQMVCLLFISRLLNRLHWFENAVCCFGQSVGVIATGLVLLRMVDPEGKTGVPAAFGYKQLIHTMFMGGGIWTSISIPLTFLFGDWIMLIFCVVVTVVWAGLCLMFVLNGKNIFKSERNSGSAAADTPLLG